MVGLGVGLGLGAAMGLSTCCRRVVVVEPATGGLQRGSRLAQRCPSGGFETRCVGCWTVAGSPGMRFAFRPLVGLDAVQKECISSGRCRSKTAAGQ